jgi:hypothetical protein
MFTLEIAGKPIAVTDASEHDARGVLESETFKEDLMQIESEGAPLWDGFATLSVRPATRAEIAAFETTPMAEGEEVDETAPLIMFLVDIDEPDERSGDNGTGTGFSHARH